MEAFHVHFPPDVLWNGAECRAYFVPKSQLDRASLESGLLKRLGYERPAAGGSVLALGLTEEKDAALDRLGLFGRKLRAGRAGRPAFTSRSGDRR